MLLYIQGYKQKNAFIITQAPLESTMEDFWRMVYETDCAVIIMLSGLEELGEVVYIYQYIVNLASVNLPNLCKHCVQKEAEALGRVLVSNIVFFWYDTLPIPNCPTGKES